MGCYNRMRRKGRKPSKQAIINRLQKIFHMDKYYEREFDIINSGVNNIVKVVYTGSRGSNESILKVQPLDSRYALYKKLPDTNSFSNGLFTSNLDDFEDDFRELRDRWLM